MNQAQMRALREISRNDKDFAITEVDGGFEVRLEGKLQGKTETFQGAIELLSVVMKPS